MRQIDFYELSNFTVPARGAINMIYLHWTGCGYDKVFSDYHLNIRKDCTLWSDMSSFTDLKYHTWHRNSGAIGIALCCCDATSNIYEDGTVIYGDCPPTDQQLDMMSKVVAKICVEIGIPVANVMTHSECAEIDGYGIHDSDPDMRWDLYGLGDLIRSKAEEYIHAWQN